jgi:hypothetical protein
VKGGRDVILGCGPDLSRWVCGVPMRENRAEVVVVRVGSKEGLGVQVLHPHSHGAGKAHPVRVGSTAVRLKVVLGDIKDNGTHRLLGRTERIALKRISRMLFSLRGDRAINSSAAATTIQVAG